jgi:opacity protein-like surface antigen
MKQLLAILAIIFLMSFSAKAADPVNVTGTQLLTVTVTTVPMSVTSLGDAVVVGTNTTNINVSADPGNITSGSLVVGFKIHGALGFDYTWTLSQSATVFGDAKVHWTTNPFATAPTGTFLATTLVDNSFAVDLGTVTVDGATTAKAYTNTITCTVPTPTGY